MKIIDEDCTILICDECGAENVLQLTGLHKKICPEELLECWSCGYELLEPVEDDAELES